MIFAVFPTIHRGLKTFSHLKAYAGTTPCAAPTPPPVAGDGVVENIKIPIAPRFRRGKTDSSRTSAVLPPPPPPPECKTSKRASDQRPTSEEGRKGAGAGGRGRAEHNGEKILTDDEDRLPFLRGTRSADFYPQHQAASTSGFQKVA